MALPRSGLGLLRSWDGLRLAAAAQVHGLKDTEGLTDRYIPYHTIYHTIFTDI